MKLMFYVYQIINLTNGKIYIGQTRSKYRWNEHLYAAQNPSSKRHRFIHRAINKYGHLNFEFRVIQYLNTQKSVLEAEKYWISFYQTNICRYPKGLGYNLTDGGESTIGLKWSNNSREKFSEQTKGENNNAAKLKTKNVIEIQDMLIKQVPIKNISKMFNVSSRLIRDIRRGKRWKHLPISDDINVLLKMQQHGNIGKIATAETRIKMSNVKKKQNLSADTLEKLSISHRGEKHHASIITEEIAKQIKEMLKSGIKAVKIARDLSLSKNIVYDIKRGKTWKHVLISL